MKRYTLTLYISDMGSFKQPGCADWADALWHTNSARAHDGLAPLDLDYLQQLSQKRRGVNWAKLTPEKEP